MPRYIDADFCKMIGGTCIAVRLTSTGEVFPIVGLDEVPSADVREIESERKKGKWVSDVAYYDEEGCPCIVSRCDQCGEPNPETNFCPNCGADMRKEEISE